MMNVKNGDLVYLKSGSVGIISRVLNNFFGDDEDIYEIKSFNNKIIFKRYKDIAQCF